MSVSVKTERVLVVPSAELDRLGRFQGFSSEADRYLDALLTPELVSFRPRSEVEDDPSFKQIIPYVIFRSGDQVFCYTRGKSQGEARLHALHSIGVGGHVSESDVDGGKTRDAYEQGLRRELEEEVEIGSNGMLTCVGLINDDSNAVGAVHLGVVHVYDLEEPVVSPREEGLANARFESLGDLRRLAERLETWSLICVEQFLVPVAGGINAC
jgi:predicted NUDIX family phosphoesterase